MPIVHQTDARVQTRLIDLGRTRVYLWAIAAVARIGAEHPNPRETLAAARIIEHDAPRGLAALEGRP